MDSNSAPGDGGIGEFDSEETDSLGASPCSREQCSEPLRAAASSAQDLSVYSSDHRRDSNPSSDREEPAEGYWEGCGAPCDSSHDEEQC